MLQSRLRRRICFDFDWMFEQADPGGAERTDFDDSSWRQLDVPHDFSIEGPFDPEAKGGGSHGFSPAGVGWYRKHFWLADPRADRVWIEFDGVYKAATVFLNGLRVGYHRQGYSSFWLDLSEHVRSGDNVMAVRVDNSDVPNCRYYSGSGIYRHVWLVEAAALHVAPWGTYVTTPVASDSGAAVRVVTNVRGPSSSPQSELQTRVVDASGVEVATATSELPAAPGACITQNLLVKDPKRWSLEEPNLYFVESIVSTNGRAIDDSITPFGIREVRFDADRGFLLNGQRVKLKGVCLHHDAGAVGAAVPHSVLCRRLSILKRLGCNAIRTSHNPPAPELLDLCDKMGFLVIDEAFDKWAGLADEEWWMKCRGFEETYQTELTTMLERDRNHPSVVLWSVGNETGEPGSENHDRWLGRLVDLVRKNEPSRAVTCGLILPHAESLDEQATAILKSGQHLDVLGLNYQEPLYPHLRTADPHIVVVGTETFKYWRSAEGLRTGFNAVNPWHDTRRFDWVCGQFLWTGFDYLGEAKTWPERGWTSGIIDTTGAIKAEGWQMACFWQKEPLVRIAVMTDSIEGPADANPWGAPRMAMHYNFAGRDGKLLRLLTFTNCESVELCVDGTSHGRRHSRDYVNGAIEWYVPYSPGRVEALARNGSTVVARHQLETTGTPTALELEADGDTLSADGQDVSHVQILLVDAKGRTVPDDDREVSVTVRGSARLLALDNGDLCCSEAYQSPKRRTREGRCLALVQARRTPGSIEVTVRSVGLNDRSLQLRAIEPG